MKYSDNAMSAILLCSYLGIGKEDLKPLSLKEWNVFLEKVSHCGQQPGVVLEQSQDFLKEAGYSPEEIVRIKALAFRGVAVAFELDDLERRGIEVVTQFDADYPRLMKRRLGGKIPPVLFASGDIALAGKVGIGMVGSRNVDDAGLQFARRLVEKASAERLVVYSGGAKGVDTVSERTAVESGGAAVSFVSESLLAKIRKKEILDAIVSGRLLLLSDMKPDAGFSAARAMNRNKYIYASSYGTFVAASDFGKGGTWAGATEALRNGWTKVLAWDGGGYEGNARLIEKGAIAYRLSDVPLYELLTKKEDKKEEKGEEKPEEKQKEEKQDEEFQQMNLSDFMGGDCPEPAGTAKKRRQK